MGGDRISFSSGGTVLPKKRPQTKGAAASRPEEAPQPLKRLKRGVTAQPLDSSSLGPIPEDNPSEAPDAHLDDVTIAVHAGSSGSGAVEILPLIGASAIVFPSAADTSAKKTRQPQAQVEIGPSNAQLAAARALDNSMNVMNEFVRQGLEKVLENTFLAEEAAAKEVIRAAAIAKDEAILARDEALAALQKEKDGNAQRKEENTQLRNKVRTIILAARRAKEGEEATLKKVEEIRVESKEITNELLKAHQLVTENLRQRQSSETKLAEAEAEIQRLKVAPATLGADVRRQVALEFFETSVWKKGYEDITSLDLDIYWGRIHGQIQTQFEVTPDDPRLSAIDPNFDADGKLACAPLPPRPSKFDALYAELMPEIQARCRILRDERFEDWVRASEESEDAGENEIAFDVDNIAAEVDRIAAEAIASLEASPAKNAEPSGAEAEMILNTPMAVMTLAPIEENQDKPVD